MCVSSVETVALGVDEDPGTLYTGGHFASEGSADLRWGLQTLGCWLTDQNPTPTSIAS